MPVDKRGQALRQWGPRCLGHEIFGHVGFTQGLQGDLVTELTGSKILLEPPQWMVREGDVLVTEGCDQHQRGGCAAARQDGDQIDR